MYEKMTQKMDVGSVKINNENVHNKTSLQLESSPRTPFQDVRVRYKSPGQKIDAPIQLKKDVADFRNRSLFDTYSALFDNIRDNVINSAADKRPRNVDGRFWGSVISAFRNNDDNIDKIIGKSFSSMTGADVGSGIGIYMGISAGARTTVINDLKRQINDTLSDIYYWSCKDNKKVKAIELTDSDVHARGIGVCIVTYEDDQKVVIKPEDKSLEAAIYGKGDSLAKDFNVMMHGKEDPVSRGATHGIGMLDIQTADNRGSKVEFFEHDDIHKSMEANFDPNTDNETDDESIQDIIAFASLLGLRDLHHENLVYSKKDSQGRRRIQLIDAEIALAQFLNESNPVATAHDSELKGYDGIAKNKRAEFEEGPNGEKRIKEKGMANFTAPKWGASINFMDAVQQKFAGKKSRIVLIPTEVLYIFRDYAYKNEFNINTTCADKTFITHIEEGIKNCHLHKICGEDLSLIVNKDKLIKRTDDDFKIGRIPYWEYDFNRGIIYQKFSNGRIPIISHKGLKLPNVIKQRKDQLTDYYTELPPQRAAKKDTEKQLVVPRVQEKYAYGLLDYIPGGNSLF